MGGVIIITGMIKYSWKASLLPAWLPPLMMLNAGTGKTNLLLPANSEMCLYKGTPFSPAPAFANAVETAKIAFAPNFPLLSVPSNSLHMNSSSAFCSLGSLPTNAGAMISLMFFTAVVQPLPIHALPPSLNSTAS